MLDRITYKDAAIATLGFAERTYDTNRQLVASVENKFYFGSGSATQVSNDAHANEDLARRSSVVHTGAAFSADHNDPLAAHAIARRRPQHTDKYNSTARQMLRGRNDERGERKLNVPFIPLLFPRRAGPNDHVTLERIHNVYRTECA